MQTPHAIRSFPALALLLLVAALWPGREGRAQALPDYYLQPGDELEISVWGEEELERSVLLRPDGRFAFPLAGEIQAAGRTAADIQAEITQELLEYIPEAVVTVSVTGLEGNQVFVIGQVESPGSFVMNPSYSVLQALSLAGGTTAFAAVNDIIVIRGRGESRQVFSFEYDDIKNGRNLEQNIQLESGDVVVVP